MSKGNGAGAPEPEVPPPGDPLRCGISLPYADPKVGKTTMLVRAFPRALFIGRRDAIQPVAEGACGLRLEPWQIIESITTLQDLVHFLSVELKTKEWQAALKAHRVTALVCDDISQMAAKSVILWRLEAETGQARGGDRGQFYPYNMLDRHLDWVSFLIADLGLMCGLSAHKQDPKYDRREKSPTYGQLLAPGAPEVPSSKQAQAVPGWATLVAPMRNGASLDPWWPKVISVDPKNDLWISGDRNSVCWEETPANLREILRAARSAYDLPRAPGLEWQDETADVVADALDRGDAVIDVIDRMAAHYGTYAAPGTPGEQHVRWAIQDGIARHTIRARRRLGVFASLRASASAALPPPPPVKG